MKKSYLKEVWISNFKLKKNNLKLGMLAHIGYPGTQEMVTGGVQTQP